LSTSVNFIVYDYNKNRANRQANLQGKIPNPKHQIPNNIQIPMFKLPKLEIASLYFCHWNFGNWNLFVIWNLSFGI